MKHPKKKNKIPVLSTDQEAEEFVENADLTQFDLSEFKPMSFEFEKKTKPIQIRLSENLYTQIKAKANELGMPYTRYIREVIERDLGLIS